MTRRSGTSETGGVQALAEDATAHQAPPGLAAAVVTADGAVGDVNAALAGPYAGNPGGICDCKGGLQDSGRRRAGLVVI